VLYNANHEGMRHGDGSPASFLYLCIQAIAAVTSKTMKDFLTNSKTLWPSSFKMLVINLILRISSILSEEGLFCL